MAYDLLASVSYAEENPLGQSIGRCARYVKKALAAGGIELQCVHAQNCSAGLEAQGFEAVMNQNTDTGSYEKVDGLIMLVSSLVAISYLSYHILIILKSLILLTREERFRQNKLM